ncbi:hypothetical protein TNCT_397791 [Trichonephila clavata]|uniref:Uncharacterized protein n=1 Tax=Trichonephila clavata TaxID=2740835 RepID=A0A8X6LNF9_TRICU|nr:hypothetical protein TNCT_397791 [Trichonephila clavata]
MIEVRGVDTELTVDVDVQIVKITSMFTDSVTRIFWSNSHPECQVRSDLNSGYYSRDWRRIHHPHNDTNHIFVSFSPIISSLWRPLK